MSATRTMKRKEKEEPKAKKQKVVEDDDEEEEDTTTTTLLRNEDGDAYVELSPKRRCTVRQWKGNVLVDIREVCQ